jgi:hypothetical protein
MKKKHKSETEKKNIRGSQRETGLKKFALPL